MHASSMEHMKRFVNKYSAQLPSNFRVLDVGSIDVNGTYKNLFDENVRYLGIDLEKGQNVDIVLKDPYFFPLASNSIDLIVSGQAFEHIEFFWLTWMEMVRVAKDGGYIFLIAPSRGPEHRYPVDCWRFYPDGYRALAKLGSCQLIEVAIDWEAHLDPGSSPWGDCVGVFKKMPRSKVKKISDFFQHHFFRMGNAFKN